MGQFLTCSALTVDVELYDVKTSTSSPRISSRKEAASVHAKSIFPLLQCDGSSVTFKSAVSLPETSNHPQFSSGRWIPRLVIPSGAMAESDIDIIGKYSGTEILLVNIEGILYTKCQHEIELRYDHSFHWTRTMRGEKHDELCVLASDSNGSWKRVQ